MAWVAHIRCGVRRSGRCGSADRTAAAAHAASFAGRRILHRVLRLGRRGRCGLVGILEEDGSAREPPASAAAAGRYEAMTRAARFALIAVFSVAAGGYVQAQTDAPPAAATAAPRAWESMSPAQQQLLQNYRGNWNSLPPERQQALATGSSRWLAMSPQQQTAARQRFSQWRAMPPEQREQLRERWHQFKSLPPEQQQRVREQYQQFRQRPEEQRRELQRQWRQMSPQQRHEVIEQHRNAVMQRMAAPAAAPRAGAERPMARVAPHPAPHYAPHAAPRRAAPHGAGPHRSR